MARFQIWSNLTLQEIESKFFVSAGIKTSWSRFLRHFRPSFVFSKMSVDGFFILFRRTKSWWWCKEIWREELLLLLLNLFEKKSCFSFKLWKPSFSEPGSSLFFRIDLLSRNPKNNLFRFHFESNYKSVVTLRRFWRSLKSSQEWEKEIHPIFISSCLFLAPAPPRPKLTDVEIKMRWKLENFIKITSAWLQVLVTANSCGLYQKNTIALNNWAVCIVFKNTL